MRKAEDVRDGASRRSRRGDGEQGRRDAGGEGSRQAPPGFCWMLVALVALVSSSMLLHEAASWVLDRAQVMGASLNVRAYSCDAHSIGLVFGYALTQAVPRRFRAMAVDARLWIVFFSVQAVNVLAFHWLLSGEGPLVAVVAVQFVGASSGAWMFATCSQAVCKLEPSEFLAAVMAVIASTTVLVQGVFAALETSALPMAFEIAHMLLVVVAAACMMLVLREGSCLRAAYADDAFLPIAAHGARGRSDRSESSGLSGLPGASGRARGSDGEGSSKDGRSIPLYVRLFVIVGAYGAVFGFLHVVPLALPLGVFSRVAAFLLGAVAALALLAVTVRADGGMDVSRIWSLFYRFVFPLVTVAALTAPLTSGSEFLPSLVLQACALYYFDALLATASYVVARAIHAAPSQVFARAFLIRSIGFVLGSAVGSVVHEHAVLDASTFSIIGTAVFVLLVVVTFNMNSERYAKTVWGLLPHEDPRGMFERRIDERCAAIAAEFGLTERESEVLALLARNKRPKEISEELVVSVATVRSHVQGIYSKTKVHSHNELLHVVEKR